LSPELKDRPPYAWYDNYFSSRVMPKISAEMEDCGGLFSWLADHDPAQYNKIEEAWTELNSLWQSQGAQNAFSAACKTWYTLLIEAKQGFDTWKRKQQEAELTVGRQERLAV
jgi:hypothetical protein